MFQRIFFYKSKSLHSPMVAELSMPEYVEHSRRLLVMKNPDSLLEVLSEGFLWLKMESHLVSSVLILSGNETDLAKHCVPSVKAKRTLIAFQKMDDRKLPYRICLILNFKESSRWTLNGKRKRTIMN
ncbi:RNA demethylase ALKBH5 [Cucumis melo var. makuwa]|uniref:RNA demethylase ALKBH5 n=1 Tax=Cucumis melo var. makuwa TaxID=1194695 RepID=A0A5A7T732_CUCMM|nr:RNA demethylase ALKBH5 [Cucumis melo var. makuwa]